MAVLLFDSHLDDHLEYLNFSKGVTVVSSRSVLISTIQNHKHKKNHKKYCYKALKCVPNKHRVFKKYKDSSHLACTKASNKASKKVRRAKYDF